MNTRIYICDDEVGMRRYLGKMLSGWGYEIIDFASPLPLLKAVERSEEEDALVLLDVRLPDLDGLETLRRIKTLRPLWPVIMMTGFGTIDSAVEAMKLGAYDFLTKPFPQEKLFATVQHCLEQRHLAEENSSLKKELRDRSTPESPVFVSAAFGEIYELALQVADSDASVLILGESGTGKELLAATVHYNSPRATNRFLAVNCAAFTETLLESQLFGHLKGAFTGAAQNQKGLLEEAHGGTLFLDEVGELSPNLQAKLLRVLQEGEFLPVGATRPKRVDVRFVAATNKDLEEEMTAGRFREDLFYRLNVIALEIPPLRQRLEDVEPLARHFLTLAGLRYRRAPRRITSEALHLLTDYHWPGNVRELENVIERAAILGRGEDLTADLLPFKLKSQAKPSPATEGEPMPLREAERIQVILALRQTGWNKSQAAQVLGITRKTLDRKIREYDLSPSDPEQAP